MGEGEEKRGDNEEGVVGGVEGGELWQGAGGGEVVVVEVVSRVECGCVPGWAVDCAVLWEISGCCGGLRLAAGDCDLLLVISACCG